MRKSKKGVAELYGSPVSSLSARLVSNGMCPFRNIGCNKSRKSNPDQTIGTCSVFCGGDDPIIICPSRFLHSTIVRNCATLLQGHRKGNHFKLKSEKKVPGGRVDYCLMSRRGREIVDFVGLELQSMDTTGTVWPARQRIISGLGLPVEQRDVRSSKSYHMNWLMTAKLMLSQLVTKTPSFAEWGKHLVFIVQDSFVEYLRRTHTFQYVHAARSADTVHFHSYRMARHGEGYQLHLRERLSVSANDVNKIRLAPPKQSLQSMLVYLGC